MSMISRQVAELREWSEHENLVEENRTMADLLFKAADTIEMLSEKARGQAWIPCEERLPEDDGKAYLTYQCCDDPRYGWCQVLNYDGGWNCFSGNRENEITNVVAWMPLPKPYKEGADDE